MEIHEIKLDAVISTAILLSVLRIIEKREVKIMRFVASVVNENIAKGKIKIYLKTDEETLRLLKSEIEKAVDVIEVK